MKDIQNLQAQTRKEHDSNELDAVVTFLKKDSNSTVEVTVDKSNKFKCLFFQHEKMKTVFAMFPELLMVDATYKLLDLKMPVYVLLAVNGHGSSEIVGLFIVADETEITIESAVECFKKHNSAWEKTKVVISDKDFTERNVFSKCFPGVILQICLFHTLRTFKRESTMEKRGITSGERSIEKRKRKYAYNKKSRQWQSQSG
jgi:zinc finger SWIM domain-containing protein 3